MSGLRMNKVVRFSAAAGFLIAILLLLAISAGKKQVASTSSDHILSNRPPVIVVGGSLYGDAGKKWVRASTCQNQSTRQDEYCADVGGNTNLLSSKNYKPSLQQTVTGSQSWKILIADKDENGNPKSDQGIVLCGNWNCHPDEASDAHYVYIMLDQTGKSEWENGSINSDGNLYFHDKSDHCGPYNSGHHQGKCEHASIAYVCIGSSCSQYTCLKGKKCKIGVGKPALGS